MSIWDKLLGRDTSVANKNRYAFVDVEIGMNDLKIHDIGALRYDEAVFHKNDKSALISFLQNVDFVCGHNIIHHDAEFLFPKNMVEWRWVDTLYMSPILFPERPYHKLVKDEKLLVDELNNPVNDCRKARDLLFSEMERWNALADDRKLLLTTLLRNQAEFDGFLDMVGATETATQVEKLIHQLYKGEICSSADIATMVRERPVALAYALALIDTTDYRSITPGWVLYHYPEVEHVIKRLRHTRCKSDGCDYCKRVMDVHHNLKQFFGYSQFRTYEDEPLQEKAVRAAVEGKSLLAVFPTGGGKSLTFQLPALMDGRSVHGLTVIISPLQSLMKDQVDNLIERGISGAVTINGMLDPISRKAAIEQVQNGDASMLYISPEMLRSRTIERILHKRHVVRFVIDEAHCFSAWGQDFRVDYMYIGKFIAEYQKQKKMAEPVPVSCFTATAKQKVIQDICDYFRKTVGIELELYATRATRTNLHYSVIHVENDKEKYAQLRKLIAETTGPAIVYVSRTKRTKELAENLTRDGFRALPFNGRMTADEKIANQEAFMNDNVRIMVATSAFGMGVDKSDVALVVHYDISDSLENYVQEAGRAGRDPRLSARCYVLYGDTDLDKHFVLLNQTKLSVSEIQQVWKAVKSLTHYRKTVNCSALEIARQAGWDNAVSDIETRVRTALAALEQSGYIERGNNVPHVYATGITVKNVDEARKRISNSNLFEKKEINNAVRIIQSLISNKNTAKSKGAEAESRIDYLADILGMTKNDVVSTVERMRQAGILADSKDISVFLKDGDSSEKKSMRRLEVCVCLERFLLQSIPDHTLRTSLKQLNDEASTANLVTLEKDIRTLLHFLSVKGYIRKNGNGRETMELSKLLPEEAMMKRFEKRIEIAKFTIEWLYRLSQAPKDDGDTSSLLKFSEVELLKAFDSRPDRLFSSAQETNLMEIEETLLYLSTIGAIKMEGGFLVLYNAMNIQRLKENRFRYKQEDYRMLNEFYQQKIQQIHIVGEYANLMVQDYDAALQFVQDYFQMDYKKFISTYFKGERANEIEQNITPKKYKQIFETLSQRQKEIIKDKTSRCIVVAAGPGSGKTRVLAHKLASLLLLEDVKHEQLLMLTFSRAAATEFKQRLMELIGEAAHFVDIKTFHSYSFDLLGRVGNLEDVQDVVQRAANMIDSGEVEQNRIAKTVLVIDEAQDMSVAEYALVTALMRCNEEMRVIAVGDDDQNIYEFRGSNSRFMYELSQREDAHFVEMTENYRSSQQVVAAANDFSRKIGHRMKTTPIVSMSKHRGYVEITQHRSPLMYRAIAEKICHNKHAGSACVLTQTNEEATIITALLQQRGCQAKLLQSTEGFHFYNLAEVRYLFRYLQKYTHTPLIAKEVWAKAKQTTYAKYANSDALVYLKRCVELFEQINKEKYLTDFKEYVFDSSVEDFCDLSGADVVVSTIHKSKGREFDEVYMLISQDKHQQNMDALMRRYYVGITRTKSRLFIHTNSNYFHQIAVDRYAYDDQPYALPDEVTLQLSLKDVHLHTFRNHKKEILSLRSGDPLTFLPPYFYAQGQSNHIAKLSNRMEKALEDWKNRGFYPVSAKICFILAWRPKNEEVQTEEYAVLLPKVILKRQHLRD